MLQVMRRVLEDGVVVLLVTVVCFVWCPPTNRGHMAAHSTLRRSQLIPGGRPLHAYASLLLRDSQSYSYIREQIQSVKGNMGELIDSPMVEH